jgi:hypothetical protein
MIGIIKTDITQLFKPELGVINPFKKQPAPKKSKRGRAHWEFEYQLVFAIDGLNMRCK